MQNQRRSINWRYGFWSMTEHFLNVNLSVTPWSGGYGDVTATYIRRSEIPSRIYAKLQYRQESEAEVQWQYTFQQNITSTWLSQRVIQYYRNIASPENTKVHHMKRYTKAERCSRVARGPREPNRRGTGRKSYDDDSDHHGRIRCALWSAPAKPPRSRLQDLNTRIQGC